MELVTTILIGLAIGSLIELLLPGHDLSELILAMLLGAAGALVARYLGELGDFYTRNEPAGFVTAAFGAILALLLYGVAFRRQRRR